jgi:7-dehydrocholesterol reductase
VLFQGLLLKFLPGESFKGPVTPAGNHPEYKLNGVAAWLVTHLALLVGVRLGVLSPRTLWEHFGSLLVTLNLVALALCAFLYWKGLRYPSTTDAVRTDHRLFDFFQGVELHPTLFGMNVKQFVHCRLSMMGWSALVLLFSAYQAELHGGLSRAMTATASLITLYLFKFFVWESGYFTSLDIMHDRFGYYLCWGLFTWVPAVYALPALSLVERSEDLHPVLAFLIVVGGVVSIWVNYAADAQRQRVRATQGNTTVWGQRPEVLPARYTTADGVERENLLLVSGFWGLARHFHYIPELTLAYLWTAPAGFSRALPWFYAVYLTILLTDRARRDDKRCAKKYGPAWEEYCRRVPWKILPGVW